MGEQTGAADPESSAARRASSSFLQDLPLLTVQQRQQVRSAFQVALLESPLPTVLTDLEGRILGTNRLVDELLGVDEAELHGRSVIDIIAEEDRHLTEAVIDRLASGRTRCESYETRWVRPDGRVLWMHRHVLRVDGPQGDTESYLVALLDDVTRARVAEREARVLRDLSRRIAAGSSLVDVAARLSELAQERWSQVGCMLNVADDAGRAVHPVPHPRLPAGLAEALVEIPISTTGMPCGMSAAYGHPVAITDMATDPRAGSMRPLLEQHGIVSGWSVPLYDVDCKLLGTLGLFHPNACEPDDADWQALSGYGDIAAIAMMVDRRRAHSAYRPPLAAGQLGVAERGVASSDVHRLVTDLVESTTIGDGTRTFLVTVAAMSDALRQAEDGPAIVSADEASGETAHQARMRIERLSAREREVVTRLLDGDRVPAIARAMYLSQSTVRNHLSAAYRKMGVTSQQELVDLFKRRPRPFGDHS